MSSISAGEPNEARLLGSYDELLAPFYASVVTGAPSIGAVWERFGARASGAPIAFEGPRGGEGILNALSQRHGWIAEPGPVPAFTRAGGRVALEAGGQLVHRSSGCSNLHDLRKEYDAHHRELAPMATELGFRWLYVGFHPFAKRSDFRFPAVSRFVTVRKYLTGEFALDMILRAASVQAQYEFTSELDAMTKLRVALKLAPVTSAMFANSPVYEGRPFGGTSFRARVWREVDSERTGLVPPVWKQDARFSDYVDWALGCPVFSGPSREAGLGPPGQPFHEFWKHGSPDGKRATVADWEAHLQTLFPDVRLGRRIEVRCADAQRPESSCALAALFTGLLYDPETLAKCDEETSDWSLEEMSAVRDQVWKTGLDTPFRGGLLRRVAERMVELAEAGLARRNVLAGDQKDERSYLEPLAALVARGRCPADDLLAGLDHVEDTKGEILRRAGTAD